MPENEKNPQAGTEEQTAKTELSDEELEGVTGGDGYPGGNGVGPIREGPSGWTTDTTTAYDKFKKGW